LKHRKTLMNPERGHNVGQQHGQMDAFAATPAPGEPSLAAPGFHFMPGLVRRRPIRIILLATAVVANSYALLRHGSVSTEPPAQAAQVAASGTAPAASGDGPQTADLSHGGQTRDPVPSFQAKTHVASLPAGTKAPAAVIKTAAGGVDARNTQALDEVDEYLWGVYQRSGRKKDSTGDFTWKDESAASHMNLTTRDYVIGGMDRDWKELLYNLGQAMDAAGINWTILSGFRDDYRQGLATGYKARVGNSFHGGSRATGGYGHGCAADIEATDGEGDDNSAVWKFVDQHGDKFGVFRPMKQIDPAHIQPSGGWHDIAFNMRDRRETTEASVLPASADGADAGAPVTTLVDKRSGISEAQYDCVRSHHQNFRVASLSHRLHAGHEFLTGGHIHRAVLHGGRARHFSRRRMMADAR
jgi:hypothetical protein